MNESEISTELRLRLGSARDELSETLRNGIVPFWLARSLDLEHGGYWTYLDAEGERIPSVGHKYIVTQARLVWAFSRFAGVGAGDPGELLAAARHGFEFLCRAFHDGDRGGWRWCVTRDGTPVDEAKLIYGQAFAVYALSEFAAATGDAFAGELAAATFDDIERHALDGANGGYLENLDADWRPAGGGSAAGDRKSLDIHLHLLEAFGRLSQLTGDPQHRRRLAEVIDVILGHMVDPASGAGGNQYDLAFRPLSPIVIDRTWVAERPADEEAGQRVVAETSYGHNLELGWLLAWADSVLDRPGVHADLIVRMAAHALRWGTDHESGGVYREGPLQGPATDTDKEFWQNAEAMPGFLQAYQISGDERYLEAFLGVWAFARDHLLHPTLREWRTRCTREGVVVAPDLGNPWKVAYHSGRSTVEAIARLEVLL